MSALLTRYALSGLGAGLAARAFELHGVNTTIVEIDSVVYEYARKYFGVEEPSGGAVLYDARAFLQEKSNVVSAPSISRQESLFELTLPHE